MKNIILKFFASVLLIAGCCSLNSCKDTEEDPIDNTISLNNLPKEAQSFINEYFYDYTIEKITQEIVDDLTLYEVYFDDGLEIVFNEEGEWQQVDAPFGKTIPTGYIPEVVLSTLNQQYHGYGINEINKTGEGYKVGLTDNQGGDGLDIYFNMSGEIISIGDTE